MKGYSTLAAALINAPQSKVPLHGKAKLEAMGEYARAVFGRSVLELPSIVVAGTKGKGSTCAVADAVLRANGLRNGLFTSPHLVTPRERIRIGGAPISEEVYVDTFYKLKTILERHKLEMPPFFALHTLMAGMLFSDGKVETAVIECGVGGRFDWTKIFDPTVTGITRLEYDHIESLGSTPRSIAWHKFGVCTERSVNFTIQQHGDFEKALTSHVRSSGLKMNIVKPEYRGLMGLRGPCAEENTAMGVAVARALYEVLGRTGFDAAAGAKAADIAGRFYEMNAGGMKWLLDGAHTTESVIHCAEWYDSLRRDSTSDVLLCSTTKKRNPSAILAPLLNGRNWKKIIYVSSYGDYDRLAHAHQAKDLAEAISVAKQATPKAVLATGSLHFIGDIMKALGWKP